MDTFRNITFKMDNDKPIIRPLVGTIRRRRNNRIVGANCAGVSPMYRRACLMKKFGNIK